MNRICYICYTALRAFEPWVGETHDIPLFDTIGWLSIVGCVAQNPQKEFRMLRQQHRTLLIKLLRQDSASGIETMWIGTCKDSEFQGIRHVRVMSTMQRQIKIQYICRTLHNHSSSSSSSSSSSASSSSCHILSCRCFITRHKSITMISL